MAMIYPFMQKLREAPFPAPGNTVEIKSFIPESGTEVRAKARQSTSNVIIYCRSQTFVCFFFSIYTVVTKDHADVQSYFSSCVGGSLS